MSNSRLIRYCAPILMLTVALVHYARVQYCHQTPWKGGGFGMFSTVDSNAARYFRAYLQVDGQWHPIKLPDRFGHYVDRIKAAPSKQAVADLANKLSILSWGADLPKSERLVKLAKEQGNRANRLFWVSANLNSNTPDSIVPTQLGERNLEVEAVRVELRKISFDREEGELESQNLWTAVVELDR